jgi:glutathione S-transferase
MNTWMLPSLITCLALFVYAWNFAKAGQARNKYGIKAPAVTGNADFERTLRVQQNMVEQLVLFLPALWIFSTTLSPLWGSLIGLVWVVARVIYSVSYYVDAEKRGPGFIVSLLASVILLLGGVVGTVIGLI